MLLWWGATARYSLPATATGARASTGQRIEQPLPATREETASAALDGRLYVLGGFDSLGRDTRTVYIFNGSRWSGGPDLPLPLDHLSAAVLNDRLYVAGGFDNGLATDGTFRLARSGRGWERVGMLRHARGALGLVAVGHTLYALGGKDGAGVEIGPAERYDPGRRRWVDVVSLPAPRDHVAAFGYHNWACIAGGRSPNTARVDCYDPAHRRWRRLPDLPLPTSGAGAAVLHGQVLVGGGEDPAESAIIPRLARLIGNHWVLSTMLVPRHGMQFAVYDGRVWACGGGSEPGLHATTTCTSIR